MPPSQTIQMSLYSPAARRPHFACSQCVCCFLTELGSKAIPTQNTHPLIALVHCSLHQPTNQHLVSSQVTKSRDLLLLKYTRLLHLPVRIGFNRPFLTTTIIVMTTAIIPRIMYLQAAQVAALPPYRSQAVDLMSITHAHAGGSLPPIGIFEKCIIQRSMVRYSLTF
jgi:hypothetical protein